MHPGDMRTDDMCPSVMVLDEMHRQPGNCQNLELFEVAFIFCIFNIVVKKNKASFWNERRYLVELHALKFFKATFNFFFLELFRTFQLLSLA